MQGEANAKPRSPYILGPRFDWAFFLLPPSAALILGIAISGTAFSEAPIVFLGHETTAATLMIGAIIHAHLVAVFFRSHGNPTIFRSFPLRFVLVPLVVWWAIGASLWAAAAATVLATFWDVWHSGLQTFGLARIYERNHGNAPDLARRLDLWLNHLLYAGPILAGATMLDHFRDFGAFESVGATWFTSIPAFMEGNQRYWTWGVLIAGTAYVGYYLFAHWRLYRQGHRFSRQKVFLLATTGLCSIYTWGFNSWGEAFFIMNLFHAVQYLALIWATEHPRMMRWLRVERAPSGFAVTALLFLGMVFAYGVWAELLDSDVNSLWAITIAVSLMHFWYDGFIWSVARKQI
jgi:hypothetical protein